jgi:hypothetical protein
MAAVVTVWEPYIHLITRYPAPGAMLAGTDSAEIDHASRSCWAASRMPSSSTPTGPW